MEINTLDILKNLAIILVAAKLLGIVARKLGAPQVVGEIIAGLIVGPCMLNFVSYDGFISGMAEIGVILLMFSAGLGTDLKELIKTGPVALLVAFAGVIVSVAGGAAVYLVFGFGDGDLLPFCGARGEGRGEARGRRPHSKKREHRKMHDGPEHPHGHCV